MRGATDPHGEAPSWFAVRLGRRGFVLSDDRMVFGKHAWIGWRVAEPLLAPLPMAFRLLQRGLEFKSLAMFFIRTTPVL
jgi:hypothetical protein